MARQKKDAVNAQTEQLNTENNNADNVAGENGNDIVDAKIDRPSAKADLAENQPARTLNKVYEEFQVEAKYEDVTDQMGKVLGKKLLGFEKKKDKPIRTTSITPDRAEYLNSQSENTGVRLYEKEGA